MRTLGWGKKEKRSGNSFWAEKNDEGFCRCYFVVWFHIQEFKALTHTHNTSLKQILWNISTASNEMLCNFLLKFIRFSRSPMNSGFYFSNHAHTALLLLLFDICCLYLFCSSSNSFSDLLLFFCCLAVVVSSDTKHLSPFNQIAPKQ